MDRREFVTMVAAASAGAVLPVPVVEAALPIETLPDYIPMFDGVFQLGQFMLLAGRENGGVMGTGTHGRLYYQIPVTKAKLAAPDPNKFSVLAPTGPAEVGVIMEGLKGPPKFFEAMAELGGKALLIPNPRYGAKPIRLFSLYGLTALDADRGSYLLEGSAIRSTEGHGLNPPPEDHPQYPFWYYASQRESQMPRR